MRKSAKTTLDYLKTATTQELKNQYLLPKGLTQKRSWNAPKDRRVRNFLDWKMTMKRTDIDLDPNWGLFEVDHHATKPEIKNYLQQGKILLGRGGQNWKFSFGGIFQWKFRDILEGSIYIYSI